MYVSCQNLRENRVAENFEYCIIMLGVNNIFASV
jgi:hypothetical protein